MKNRILILGLLVIAFAIVNLFFYKVEKPMVKYTVNNSFPVVSGDTLSIDFYFESEHDLTFFSSKVNFGVEILNEVVKFVKGNKAGNLNYAFVIPENCRKENIMNLQFEIKSEFGSDNVFITVPVYNPPYNVNKELLQVEDFSEVSVQSFFSSKNLIIENDLLAELGETSGFSKFNVDELQNFNLNDYLYKEKISSGANNFIISNLLEAPKKLIRDEKNLSTASIFSISELTDKNLKSKDFRKLVLHNFKLAKASTQFTRKKATKLVHSASDVQKFTATKEKNIQPKQSKPKSEEIVLNENEILALNSPILKSDLTEIPSNEELEFEPNAIKHDERVEFIEDKRLSDIKIDIQIGLSDMKIEETSFVETKQK